jgi:hypothetical protein
MTRNRNQNKKSEPFIKLGFPPSDELYQIPWEHELGKWEEMGRQLHKIHSELTRSGQLPRNKRISRNNQNR